MDAENKQLRRKRWGGGLHPEDVAAAFADLARRNLDVARELAASKQREAALAEELEGFKSALRQVSSLLTLAEDRAEEIEREARELAAESLREVTRLEETKRETIAGLTHLRAQLDAAIGTQLRAVG
jgi:predicted  nucleic acid-binding Zn-ribbon protein